MSDWEYLCDSMGWANNENAIENLIDYVNPQERKVHIDDITYKISLINAFDRNRDLITENHVFTTFNEAAKAAQELAIKTQSNVKIFKTKSGFFGKAEQEIYLIHDPEMKEAVGLVKENEYGIYPDHPLIKLREQDLLSQENSGEWHFVAHPDGTTENIKKSLCALFVSGVQTTYLRKSMGDGLMILQRDEVLNMALVQAKAHQIKVYVTRTDSFNYHNEHSATYYTYTEKQLKEALLEHEKFMNEHPYL